MRLASLAAALSALLLVNACSDRATDSGTGRAGGTMVFVVGGSEPTPLLPPFTADIMSKIIVDQLFDRLAEIGPDLNSIGDKGFQPRLARSWSWSRDSLSVAFALDPRARWHDGRPVRAEDVKFSFDLNKNPRTGSGITAVLGNVDSVTVRDSLTPVVWFHRRTPEQFYDFVYQVQVLPAHILAGTAPDKLATSDVVRRPIGTGRFRFVRWDPGLRIELIADTANYRGRSNLDRFVMAFAADGGAAITQLLSGQADFFDNVPADVLPRLDSTGSIRALNYPGTGYTYLGMNLRDPKRLAAPHPIFGDRRVRLAISMGLDRQAMLRNVFDSLGKLGTGPFVRTLGDTTIRLPAFDRARAAALLDSAGWVAGSGGIRAKSGRPLAFPLAVPTSSRPRMRYAVLIQEQLKGLGIRVDIEAMDISAFIDRTTKRNFDAAMMAYNSDPSIATAVKQAWTTSNIGNGLQNLLSYSNPAFDALVDSAAASFDADRARGMYHRAYQMLADDAPGVWLYELLTIGGLHKRIRPEGLRTDGWWVNLPDWWIPANERIDRDRIGLRPAQP